MKSQLTRQMRVFAMEEPDPTGVLEKVALFDEAGNPIDLSGPPEIPSLDLIPSPESDLDLNGFKLVNVADPEDDQDAATRAFVLSQISDLIGGAPGTLDTLNELAEKLGDDEDVVTALIATVASKATEAFVLSQISDLVDGAPGTLDTLNELAEKLGDDEDVVTALIATVASKATEATRAASGKGFANHGAVAGTARPTGYASIEWVGSVEPTNAVNGDTWVNTEA